MTPFCMRTRRRDMMASLQPDPLSTRKKDCDNRDLHGRIDCRECRAGWRPPAPAILLCSPLFCSDRLLTVCSTGAIAGLRRFHVHIHEVRQRNIPIAMPGHSTCEVHIKPLVALTPPLYTGFHLRRTSVTHPLSFGYKGSSFVYAGTLEM